MSEVSLHHAAGFTQAMRPTGAAHCGFPTTFLTWHICVGEIVVDLAHLKCLGWLKSLLGGDTWGVLEFAPGVVG